MTKIDLVRLDFGCERVKFENLISDTGIRQI